MKLIVFGATRGTGKQVVEQGLAAGHEITAIARRPEAITIQHPCLHIIRGDILEPASFEKFITKQDGVISTIGVGNNEPTTLYSEGLANVIKAMYTANVRRLICVSASGLDPGPLWQRVIAKPILWTIFKYGYADMVRMETEVQNSILDWTIIRPPRLTDKPLTGHYHVSLNKHLMSGWQLSRADLAHYILAQLENRSTYRALVEIAH